MEIEELIIKHLTQGKTQIEIAAILKYSGVKPNSLRHIEKILQNMRHKYGANTMFHLAILLNKRK